MENDLPNANGSDRLNNQVAITIALFSAFMAITKVKDDNIVQAMQVAKADAVDLWNEYQAKKIKQHLDEIGVIQFKVMAETSTSQLLKNEIKRLEDDIQRYKIEGVDLQTKAKDSEAKYDRLNDRDDQFDLSDAALSLSVAILATTALTRKKALLYGSWIFGLLGIVSGLAGFFGGHFRIEWLIKLLS